MRRMTVCLTSTSAHPTRFGAYAYPAWQPVTSAVQGWIVCHPRSSLLHSTPLSVSCRSCLLSCSPLWPHLSQMSGAAYPVNLCVRACVGVCLHLQRSFSLVPLLMTIWRHTLIIRDTQRQERRRATLRFMKYLQTSNAREGLTIPWVEDVKRIPPPR